MILIDDLGDFEEGVSGRVNGDDGVDKEWFVAIGGFGDFVEDYGVELIFEVCGGGGDFAMSVYDFGCDFFFFGLSEIYVIFLELCEQGFDL